MEINYWNGNNFPYKLSINKVNNSFILKLEKYLLDNLFGDINLEDAPIVTLLVHPSASEQDCLKYAKEYIPEIMPN